MVTPELGLAALDSAVTSIKLLIWIVKTVKEVRRFKATCLEFGKMATILQDIIAKHQTILETQMTFFSLNKLLQEIQNFVVRCTTDWNFAQRAWEVMWRKRLPHMLSQMREWIVYLTFETTLEVRSAVAEQVSTQKENFKVVERIEGTTQEILKADSQNALDRAQVQAVLDIVSGMQKNKSEAKSENLTVQFTKNDPRLKIIDKLPGEAIPFAAKLNNLQVMCVPSITNDQTYNVNVPRHIAIYSRIAAHTLVHPFYGIADIDHPQCKYWAVMQNLSGYPTLAQSLPNDLLAQDPHSRLKIAVELSRTVGFLHSISIVVKNLSDGNVIMRKTGEGLQEPILTHLEEARLFLEHTAGIAYDVRYEAPEYQETSMHSTYTDVWALESLIQQIMSGAAPFGITEPVYAHDAAAVDIRRALAKSDSSNQIALTSNNSKLLLTVQKIVLECHRRTPSLRPSAASVTEKLFDIYANSFCNNAEDPPDASTVKEEILAALERKEEGPQPTSESWQILRSSAQGGDPVACLLMGRAIWSGVIDEGEDRNQVVLVTNTDEVKKALSAQQYFEFALSAGIAEAARHLQYVHVCLAKAFRELANRE